MKTMREKFEELENVKDKLKWVYFCNDKYFERELEYRSSAIWMNGALYAFQEQQQKINNLKKYLINSCAFDDNYIEELLNESQPK